MDDRQTPPPREWPCAWLMTDSRLGDSLWDVLARMPAGTGVVLRDSSLGEQVARVCAERGLTLAVSRDPALGEALGAALVHNPAHETALPFSRAVHDEAEARQARADGAALVFVSPLFATRSHPDAAPLGAAEGERLARLSGTRAIAMGGMNADRFAKISERGFYGWAGIDAWLSA